MAFGTFALIFGVLVVVLVALMVLHTRQARGSTPDAFDATDGPQVLQPASPAPPLTVSEIAVGVATGLWLFVATVAAAGALGAAVFVLVLRSR